MWPRKSTKTPICGVSYIQLMFSFHIAEILAYDQIVRGSQLLQPPKSQSSESSFWVVNTVQFPKINPRLK